MLDYASILTVPDYTLIERLTGVQMSEKERDRYIDFESEQFHWKHQLLGHAHEVQSSMQLWCVLGLSGLWFSEILQPDRQLTPEGEGLEAKAIDDWRLLLQLQSLDTAAITAQGDLWNVDWGLGGSLYFCIRKGDLAQRNFSDVWLQLQTT